MTQKLVERLRLLHPTEDTTGFDILDFLSAFGSPAYALAYSFLLWPDFVEFDGLILLASEVQDNADRQRVRDVVSRIGDLTETEKALNSFEVPSDFFASGLSTTSDEEDLFLAYRMKEMWSARLATTFPDLHFTVEVLASDSIGQENTVRFYVNR